MSQLKGIDLAQDFFVSIVKKMSKHNYFFRGNDFEGILGSQKGYEECLYSIFGAIVMNYYCNSPFCSPALSGYGRIPPKLAKSESKEKYDFVVLSKYKDSNTELLTLVEFKGPTTWDYLLGGSIKKGSEEISKKVC